MVGARKARQRRQRIRRASLLSFIRRQDLISFRAAPRREPHAVEHTGHDQQHFVVRDHSGQVLTCVYFEVEPGRRSGGTLFTRDEARHLAAAIAKLPELLNQPRYCGDANARVASLNCYEIQV
jgi:hypothetical protein